MPKCLCGCNTETAGDWAPGHDQRFRVETAAMIGGDRALRELAVESRKYALGDASLSEFSDSVRRLFARLNG